MFFPKNDLEIKLYQSMCTENIGPIINLMCPLAILFDTKIICCYETIVDTKIICCYETIVDTKIICCYETIVDTKIIYATKIFNNF